MTMSKKTVTEIKSELDNLGVEYKSGLRKAELLSLLEKKSPVVDEHYSPPYTRNRMTMSTADMKKVKSNLSKLEGSPVNHASAVIEELEVNNSEEVSVDVKITKETTPIVEVVVSSGTEQTSSGDASEQTNSDAELAADLKQKPETKKATRSKSRQNSADKTVKASEQVTKRRSARISTNLIKKHAACPGTGTLFSDDEAAQAADNASNSSEEDVQATTARRSLLMKIFIFSIIFAVIANILAYVHLSHPEVLAGIQQKAVSVLLLLRPESISQ